MIIEFTNTIPPKTHSTISVAIVIATCAFFFIPTTLIVLGYLSSQPTGNLISPLPQGVLGENTPISSPTPSPLATNPVIPSQVEESQSIQSTAPIIAAPGDPSTTAESDIASKSFNNIIDKTASISANLTETVVKDSDIKLTSQIYLSPRPNDKATYSVKNKLEGQMVIVVDAPSDTLRYIDYHIVNP